MKARITFWLIFFLFIWSSFGKGIKAQNEFPYHLTPDTPGFKGYGSFEWTDNGIISNEAGFEFRLDIDLSQLNHPSISFKGKGFILNETHYVDEVIAKSDASHLESIFLLLDKNSSTLWFKTIKGCTLEISDLIIQETDGTDLIINKFPYTLSRYAKGWKLNGAIWNNTDEALFTSMFSIATITSPELQLPDTGGTIIITGSTYILQTSENGSDYTLLANNRSSGTLSYILPKETKYLQITNEQENKLSKISNIQIHETSGEMKWTEEKDGCTLTGTSVLYPTIVCFWMPQITVYENKAFAFFNVSNPDPENIQLFYVEKVNNGIIKETEITETNGMVNICLSNTSNSHSTINGFKAISKGGKIPTVKISKYFAGEITPVMQFDLSKWYDEDGDGILDFFYGNDDRDYRGKYKMLPDGSIIKYGNLPEGIADIYPYNLNNDNAIDYYGYRSELYHQHYKAYSNYENGETKISQESDNIFIPCDYNSDGLTDFLLENNQVAIQLTDGSFTTHQLTVWTQEQYLNRDKSNNEWSQNSFHSGIITQNMSDAFLSKEDMFIGGGGKYQGSMGYQVSDVDFDKDGRPDLINTSTGQLLLNVSKDNYVSLPLGGSLYFRDLNNDQRLDYIVYEPTTKTVHSHVYQKDGTEKVQQLISNLSMDQQVWCYDFDKDGDVDILLPFSYLDSNGASFLVIMENDGTGKFKMHESYFDEQLQFVACADIDNDGYYDIIAKDCNNPHIYILKGNKKMQFELQTTPLLILVSEGMEGLTCNVQIADINHDGIYELLTCYKDALVYNLSDLIPGITSNKAPEKPKKPSYLFEPSTGYLKISWEQGKDAESSSSDLTYALRIGTEPGKGNIYYANAMEDGTRLNLLDGNMSYNLDKLLDASGWNAGKYYIAVQTIDPMHNGSAWSEETVFDKTQLSAGFRLSYMQRTVADTLTLALTSPIDLSLKYKWSMDEATIIASNEDKSIYRIQFTTPGEKHITLQTEDSNGNVSAIQEKVLFIFANKITPEDISTSPETYLEHAVDLDNDGIIELLTRNGVYESNGKGEYTKIKKIYNTNLSFGSTYSSCKYITDHNKDGLPDIIYSSFDGNKYFTNHYINEGDKTLSVNQYDGSISVFNETASTYTDLNHDGNMDIKVLLSSLYLNSGNDRDFSKIDDFGYISGIYLTDLNQDGFLDVIDKKLNDNNVRTFINNGDGTFHSNTMPVNIGEFIDISAVGDMNNDGYSDLIIQKNNRTILIALNGKNKDFNEIKEIQLPKEFNGLKVLNLFDFDNNGYLDIAFATDSPNGILYLYDNWDTQLVLFDYNDHSWNGHINMLDIDNNGTPDFTDEYDYYYKNTTTVGNTRPDAPANVRGTQKDNFVVLQWDAAKDAETPYVQMRYNVSVKKQGVDGEEAFIISPMNELKAEAAIIPYCTYPMGTIYSIPLSAIPAGSYEVQVQAIDGWNMTSAFSQPYLLTVTSDPKIEIQSAICAGISTQITYKGNGNHSELTWNWDGGQLLHQEGNNYEVVWNEGGNKQISVTYSGVTSTTQLYVSPEIDGAFTINDKALLNSETTITLPEGNFTYNWLVDIDGRGLKSLNEYRISPVIITRNGNTREAKAVFKTKGHFVLCLALNTPCGINFNYKEVDVTDEVERQEIDLVTVDQATGKYCISWKYTEPLPDFISGINIYKEGSKYNDFRLLTTVPVTENYYVDPASNPQIAASRYKLTLQTNYGAETTPGKAHQGIHVMINKGIGNSWNLIWSQYEGASIETYRILRGTTPETMEVIGEVSGNSTSYSDINLPDGATYYYGIDFDAKYEDNWNPMFAQRQTEYIADAIRSNIVCTANASEVIFAESIIIRSIESNMALSPEQPILHFFTDIYPLATTLKSANWSIISGTEFAEINQNGELTAIGKNGNVTIRISTIDGSNLYAEQKIEISGFTDIKAESISIYAEEAMIALSPSQKQLHLEAGVLPANATNKDVRWSVLSGESIATIDQNGVLTATEKENGTVTVRATIADNPSIYADLSVYATDFNGSGLMEINNSLKIYPSPVYDLLFIENVPLTNSKAILSITNQSGQEIYRKVIHEAETSFSCKNYPEGIYLIRIITDKEVITNRFMKK